MNTIKTEGEKEEIMLKCPKCGVPFCNAWDDYSDEISDYLYEPRCSHYPKNVVISVG